MAAGRRGDCTTSPNCLAQFVLAGKALKKLFHSFCSLGDGALRAPQSGITPSLLLLIRSGFANHAFRHPQHEHMTTSAHSTKPTHEPSRPNLILTFALVNTLVRNQKS
jgi:hypothetical protein